ncbi:hypothetical protein [Nocardia sp. NPDC058497]|uniref:hypothetical protein n=1 Tax=Nocardia sp. NPDC058497 TaxID=3346529 RepID=UPI00364B421E
MPVTSAAAFSPEGAPDDAAEAGAVRLVDVHHRRGRLPRNSSGAHPLIEAGNSPGAFSSRAVPELDPHRTTRRVDPSSLVHNMIRPRTAAADGPPVSRPLLAHHVIGWAVVRWPGIGGAGGQAIGA